MKKGLIYIAKNIINGKSYIGQTRKGFLKRIAQHGRLSFFSSKRAAFYNAIRKHGIGSFDWDILEKDVLIEDLDEREIFWIKKLNTIIPYGYNSTEGGVGPKWLPESRRKASISHTGKKQPKEQAQRSRERMMGNQHGKGKIRSEEWKKMMSEKNKGNKYGKGNKSRTGQKRSEEERLKSSISQKKSWEKGTGKRKKAVTFELAKRVKDLSRHHTQEEISKITGASRSSVQRSLYLLNKQNEKETKIY